MYFGFVSAGLEAIQFVNAVSETEMKLMNVATCEKKFHKNL